MIIDCISDLHGFYPKLEGGDLLIVAGDLTARDTFVEHCEFRKWLYEQPYKKKVVIAGNHDNQMTKLRADDSVFSSYNIKTGEQVSYASYLMDSGTEFEGLKIWGSPWTPTFLNWHFMKDRGAAIREKWDLIPNDIDILVTHGPPFGILDKNKKGDFVGCEELRTTVERIQPRLHVFGHIHEGYGQVILKCTPTDVKCVNCSIMNERYKAVNKPVRVII